jgi:hypothetical protein
MLRPIAAALLALAASPAWADDLQTRLVAGARATDTAGYAFRETITIAGNGPGMDKAGKTYVNAYDPRRAPADRWRLLTVDGRAPTDKELAQSRKTKRDSVPSYDDIAKWLGSPATRVDGAGAVTYRYARLPAGTIKLGKHDASADTAAEIQVAGASGPAPYVGQLRFTSTKGFRMMLVASVKSMATTMHFRRLVDGAVVPADVRSDIAGSMMGKSGALKTTVSYADWQKVR